MAEKMATLDFRELEDFIKIFLNPKITARSAKGKSFAVIRAVINDQAKSVQSIAKNKEIPSSMRTRPGSFNQKSIWSTFAKKRQMVAITGARDDFGKANNYLGLANIELGRSERNEGVPTTDRSRGGSESRKVFPSKRFNAMKQVIKVSGGNARKTMAILSNRGYKGFIYHRAGLNIPKGIYQFFGRKTRNPESGRIGFRLGMIKNLEKSKTTPTRNKWLWRSTQKGTKPALNERFFKRNADIVFKGKSFKKQVRGKISKEDQLTLNNLFK